VTPLRALFGSCFAPESKRTAGVRANGVDDDDANISHETVLMKEKEREHDAARKAGARANGSIAAAA
jgi:hypothetical protein